MVQVIPQTRHPHRKYRHQHRRAQQAYTATTPRGPEQRRRLPRNHPFRAPRAQVTSGLRHTAPHPAQAAPPFPQPARTPHHRRSGTTRKARHERQPSRGPEDRRGLGPPADPRSVPRTAAARHRTAAQQPAQCRKAPGIFRCAACNTPLFDSSTKYESGSGWPSFYRPIEHAIGTTVDTTHGMRRVAVHCATCGGHLGHVFPDGPDPTGDRYCMNGVALSSSLKTRHDRILRAGR